MSTFKESVPAAAAGHLWPQSLANTGSTQTTGCWTKLARGGKVHAICMTATLSAGAATYQFYGAEDADGTGADAIAGTLVHSTAKSIGYLELDQSLVVATHPYISVVCTTSGGGTGICGAAVLQFDPNFTG
jgi:hypothetical protein